MRLLCLSLAVTLPLTAQDIAEKMKALGLVRVQDIVPTIRVDLKYNSTDNFVGVNMYQGLADAYLQPHMVQKLQQAQQYLQKHYSAAYRLVIYDAARPLSAQRTMYQQVQGTPNKVYVASPKRGGRHNYGVAVDLSIWNDSIQQALDMGSGFDVFGPVSHVGNEAELVRQKKITPQAKRNRQMLYTVMRKVGLVPYRREWWHYEEPEPMSVVRKKYPLLNF